MTATERTEPPPVPGPVPPQRIPPLAEDQRSERVDELLESMKVGPNGEVLELFTTLAHHPKLLKRWSAFGGLLLFGGELPARARELLILRTAWNSEATYEWVHHQSLARVAGLDETEVARVAAGPSAEGWGEDDADILRAADELHEGARISDATWQALSGRYSQAQLIEICMVVGQYHLVAFTLRSLGVQLEDWSS